jgi:hypothetical protein
MVAMSQYRRFQLAGPERLGIELQECRDHPLLTSSYAREWWLWDHRRKARMPSQQLRCALILR